MTSFPPALAPAILPQIFKPILCPSSTFKNQLPVTFTAHKVWLKLWRYISHLHLLKVEEQIHLHSNASVWSGEVRVSVSEQRTASSFLCSSFVVQILIAVNDYVAKCNLLIVKYFTTDTKFPSLSTVSIDKYHRFAFMQHWMVRFTVWKAMSSAMNSILHGHREVIWQVSFNVSIQLVDIIMQLNM